MSRNSLTEEAYSAQKQETPVQPEPQLGNSILETIALQIPKYRLMHTHYTDFATTPAEMLSVGGIDRCIDHLNRDSELMFECLSFLDMITLMETMYLPPNGESVIGMFLTSIHKSRISDLGSEGYRSQVTEQPTNLNVLSSRERTNSIGKDFVEFLNTNRPILAIYIFTLVAKMFDINIIVND